jgi:trigger factor
MTEWRVMRLEGKTLSQNETLEEKNQPVEAAHDHEGHDHDHDHDHEGHTHAHGPVLNPECTRELVLDVPADVVAKAYKQVTANYKKFARIPGFRPGKTPDAVVRRRFFNEIRKDVIDQILPERFSAAVQELGVQPVGQPQVTELTVEEGQPLHVKASFEFLPEYSIDGYKDVTVVKTAIEITEEEFQAEMKHLLESRAEIEPVEEDRALVDGDWAQISYNGTVTGEEDAAPVAGENSLVEVGGTETVAAFSDALRGAKVGQEIKVEVVYPDDYAEPRLAGKAVAYEMSVLAIKKRILPELNDEFVKDLGQYENVADLEKAVREHMTNRKKHMADTDTREKLFAAYAEKFSFPVPESLVQEQIDARLERGLRALAAQGMSPEQMRKLDFARLRGAQRDSALSEVKIGLILDKIAREENITVSDEDMDKELQMAALQTREPIDVLRARLEQEGTAVRIREQVLRDKTMNVLLERMPA